jgi:hypothetical protein
LFVIFFWLPRLRQAEGMTTIFFAKRIPGYKSSSSSSMRKWLLGELDPASTFKYREIALSMSTAELVAAYMGAIGTLLAVVLALFLQVILVRIEQPRIYLTLSPDLADEDAIVNEDSAKITYWVRCKVWVARGKNPARNAEILVQRITRPAGASNSKVAPGGTLKWTDLIATQVTIPSGAWRRVDLLRYWWPKVDPDAEPVLSVALSRTAGQTPSRDRHWLNDEGVYMVDFVIVADGVEPSFWRLTFEHRRNEDALPSRIHNLHLAQQNYPSHEEA